MRDPELKRPGGFLPLALSGAALVLSGYAAFGRARAPAAAPAACSCDDQALRRDVEALSRRVDVVASVAMAPRGAPEQAPAATAGGDASAAAPAPPARPVETVEAGDGGLVVKTRMPDGTVVITRTGPLGR